jgi:methylenetetrahydrofolate reductase (NADPH)
MSAAPETAPGLPLSRAAARIAPLPQRDATAAPPLLSFEFSPPRNEAAAQQLWHCIARLAPLKPRFVSVTYGAGGSTKAHTHETVARLARETELPPAAHLTCAGATREAVDEIARGYWDAGVRHIVALRGDPPPGTEFVPHPAGYAFASDLVAGLRRIADFEISVAAYPETHPSASSKQADIDNLKRKLDAGATRAITNYCFDTSIFLRFLENCRAAGITAPIIPGILPVSNYAQAVRISATCGASVPGWLGHLFEGTEHDPETQRMVAAIIAAEQVRLLQANGVDAFHLYTMNRPELSYAIAHILGARPKLPAEAGSMG